MTTETMTTEKITPWFEGMNAQTIAYEIARHHVEIVTTLKFKPRILMEEAKTMEREFLAKYDSVQMPIINMKTEFWAYNKTVYMEWHECLEFIRGVYTNLNKDLNEIYVNKGWA